MSMTVDEIKKSKVDLESSILKLLNKFESDTKTYISYISTERKRIKSKKRNSIDRYVDVPEPERRGPLVDVNIDLRFDI